MYPRKFYQIFILLVVLLIGSPLNAFASGHVLSGIGRAITVVLFGQSVLITLSLFFLFMHNREKAVIPGLFMALNLIWLLVAVIIFNEAAFLAVIFLPEFLFYFSMYRIEKNQRLSNASKIVWLSLLLSVFYYGCCFYFSLEEDTFLLFQWVSAVAGCFLLPVYLFKKAGLFHNGYTYLASLLLLLVDGLLSYWAVRCTLFEPNAYLAYSLFFILNILVVFILFWALAREILKVKSAVYSLGALLMAGYMVIFFILNNAEYNHWGTVSYLGPSAEMALKWLFIPASNLAIGAYGYFTLKQYPESI